ncbi:MAG TPA: DUF3450 family protein [Opitutaceae bacterium]|nr:DUF3450 family protein [Opitutaceae bacterium]
MLLPLFRARGWILVCVFTLTVVLASRAEESIDSVEKAAVEWAKIRAETVRLETEWKSRRELLESSQVALKERIRFLENKRDALTAKTASERQSLAALNENTATATRAMATVTTHLNQLTAQVVQLRPSLPPRLSQALELPYRSLADTAISPGDKVQLLVKLLNRCAQFNKSVTFAEEALSPETGAPPRLLEVLYWGLSHGYALDRTSGKAYYGSPGEKAWTWEVLNGETERISTLIAIYKDKADPLFVDVPARISPFPAEPKR